MTVFPVVTVAWAFGRMASANEVEKVDARLHAAVGGALAEYGRALAEAHEEALALARSRSVQQALADRDRATLAAVARRSGDAVFRAPDGSVLAGRPDAAAASRSVAVAADGTEVGRVGVLVRIDGELLARLRAPATPSTRTELALAQGGRVAHGPGGASGALDLHEGRPASIELASGRYRAVAAELPGAAGGEVVALEPEGPIAATARSVRRRAAGAALLTLATAALLGLVAAPALARRRTLRRRRDQAALVLSHVGDGVFLLDERGVVRSWNPAAAEITGLPAEEVEGRSADDVIPAWPALRSAIPVARRPGDRPAARDATLPVELPSGERWLTVSGVESEDGTVYAFRDVTDERWLERARNDLVATVSHELRTPLTSIYGAAMTLERQYDRLGDEARRRLLSLVTEQSERLVGIVEDIGLAGRLDVGHLDVAEATFDAVRVLREVVEAARAELPQELSVEVVVPEPVPPARGDAARARQVLANLVDNAVKYSPERGRIEARVESTDSHVRISISDEGLGIPPNERERVFEKFYRLDPGMSRGVGGTGLGLYVARKLAEQMDGTVEVAPTSGPGSTFVFRLPAGPAARAA